MIENISEPHAALTDKAQSSSRREFIVVAASVLAANFMPVTVPFGSLAHLQPLESLIAADDTRSLGAIVGGISAWLSYPSDPNDIWYSADVLVGVR